MLHNFYQAPGGGEDVSFFQEVNLLRSHGHEVFTFTASNDDIRKLGRLQAVNHLVLNSAWSRRQFNAVQKMVRHVQPDIAHVQNFWYMLSPSVHAACHSEGIPVVQHLRNFRLGCLNGLLFRRGKICDRCVGRSPWFGLVFRCYRNSFFASIAVYRMITANRRLRTWNTCVQRFICLTKQSRSVFLKIGLPENKLSLRSNFLPDPGFPPEPSGNPVALFVGRLSPEKGFDVLVNAWKRIASPGLVLRVCGGQTDVIARLKKQLDAHDIDFLGHVSQEEVIRQLKSAHFLVMPTSWYENMPRVVVEAFACGRPVIGSNLGALAEMVDHNRTGLLFEPRNPADLAKNLAFAISQPYEISRMSREARREYEARYSPEKAYNSLMSIYEQVLKNSRSRSNP